MQILGLERLDEFCRKHRRATKSVTIWRKIVETADWSKFADVRSSLPKTDKVGDCYVFNIGGNNYRLVAKIDFNQNLVSVRKLMTHSEYDKTNWKETCGCERKARTSKSELEAGRQKLNPKKRTR